MNMTSTPSRRTGATSARSAPPLLAAVIALLVAASDGAAAQEPAKGFEARLDAAVASLASDPRFKGLSEAQRRDRIEFVVGNVLFALMHEVGHMAISEMG